MPASSPTWRSEDRKQTWCWGSVRRVQKSSHWEGWGRPWAEGREGTQREGLVTIYRSFPSQGHRAEAAPSGEDARTQCFREAMQGKVGLPNRCGSNLHLRPQATGCHHLSCGPTDQPRTRCGSQVGTQVKCEGGPPLCSDPCWVSRGRVPLPFSPGKPATCPAPATPSQLSELGTFDVYFVLSIVQKELRSPRTRPRLNLPSGELPAGQLRRLRCWIRAGFT